MKKSLIQKISVVVLLVLTTCLSNGQNCFIVENSSNNLHEVQFATGNLVATTSISSSTGSINGFYGVARNPIDNEIYALVDEGSGVRSFGVLNVATNTYDEIGSVSYIFESMEFSSNGTCYAMTASNDDTPSRLVTVNLLNGSVSILADLSNDDGEGFAQALVYDESSETMYRCTGGGGDFGSQFYYWQTINLTTNTITNQEVMFPGLSDSFPWVMAMCYLGPNDYLLADQTVMYNIDSNGDFDTPRSLNFGDQRYSGIVLATDQQIEGCLDPTACNYNSEATLNSFDCVFLPMDDDCAYCSGETDGTGEVIVGMDSDNDWICDLDEIEIWGTDPFVQDTDGDGITDGAEILVVMTDPLNIDTNNNDCDDLNELIDGCGIGPDDCLGDFNSDGLVNTTDLLVFLGSFGSVCN